MVFYECVVSTKHTTRKAQLVTLVLSPFVTTAMFSLAHFLFHFHGFNVLRVEFRALSAMMKQISHKVVENGGIVRSIQNHGIRQFPHRVQAKNPDFITGQRYFEKGRYISVYYDSNPGTRTLVERFLAMDDQVLRNTHLKARSKLDWITMQRPDKNPYVQRVLRMDQEKQQEKSTADSMIETDKK
jgi:ribosomal protein S6